MDAHSNRSVERGCVAMIAGCVIAVPVFAACYQSHFVGKTCDITSCDTSQACTQVTTVLNEDAYIAIEGNRTSITNWDSVCHKTWKEFNAMAQCVVNKSCDPVAFGSKATGGICPVEDPD